MIQRTLILIAALAFGFGTIACEPAVAAITDSCVQTVSMLDGHFEGDSDQTSHGGGKETAHHHAPCTGHCAAATRMEAPAETFAIVREFPISGTDAWRPLAHGFEQLRPPIA